jgi:hypothetical protein
MRSVLGHRDTGTREPAEAWVKDVYPSLMPELSANAR